MVLEVLADARQVGDDADPMLAQLRGRADPGEQQQLWRAECAGGEDRLLARRGHPGAAPLAVAHAGGAAAVDLDAEHLGARNDVEVVAAERRAQVGVGGAPAAAAPLGHLGERGAVLLGPVVVGDAGDPGRRA